jgi:TRAP-type mannitol/chloroaromatic compound transport system permease small subunit
MTIMLIGIWFIPDAYQSYVQCLHIQRGLGSPIVETRTTHMEIHVNLCNLFGCFFLLPVVLIYIYMFVPMYLTNARNKFMSLHGFLKEQDIAHPTLI